MVQGEHGPTRRPLYYAAKIIHEWNYADGKEKEWHQTLLEEEDESAEKFEAKHGDASSNEKAAALNVAPKAQKKKRVSGKVKDSAKRKAVEAPDGERAPVHTKESKLEITNRRNRHYISSSDDD